jgi:GAF domain-containing protein
MRSDSTSTTVVPQAAIAREDLAFRSIVQATADKSGKDFLRSLVKHLALALDVAYAFVAEFSGSPRRVQTVALWGPDGWLENIQYDLVDTPCEEVLKGSLCFHPQGVQDRFPRDAILTKIGASSFLGVPLRAASGETLGHLAVIDTKPLPPDSTLHSVFQIFADRARVELERLRADYVLERASRELEFRLKRTSHDLKLAHDELAALLEVNQSVARHLQRDELFAALAKCLRHVMPTDRFGIELPIDGGRLRAHLFAPLNDTPGVAQIKELPAGGTACHWVEQNQQWFVCSDRDEVRQRFPITFEVMSQEGMQSLCAMPLVSGRGSIGVLFFMAAKQAAYRELRPRAA